MDFGKLATEESLKSTTSALESKGYTVTVVSTEEEALEEIKKSIPDGASVMNGASVTLEQIGFVDYLKSGNHPWKDLHAAVTSENDEAKRHELRRQSVLSDYYLGSVHALTETGDFIVASNTGSQLPHVVSTSPNLVYVVSTKKIVKDIDEALKRLHEYVIPLEDQHMQDLYKVNTKLNKLVISYGESPMTSRTTHFILVNKDLGY